MRARRRAPALVLAPIAAVALFDLVGDAALTFGLGGVVLLAAG